MFLLDVYIFSIPYLVFCKTVLFEIKLLCIKIRMYDVYTHVYIFILHGDCNLYVSLGSSGLN